MPRKMNPNSLANLKRGKRFGNNDDPTTISASEAGKKSQKKAKEKKSIAECMEMILGAKVKDDSMRKTMATMFGVEKEDQTYAALMTIAMVQRAIKGDVSAAKLAVDLTESRSDAQKQMDRIEEIMNRLDAESGCSNA